MPDTAARGLSTAPAGAPIIAAMTARPTPSADTLERLARIVGPANAFTAAADIEPYLVEWRDKYRGATPLVLRPGSVAEVSAILALANETRTAIVAQGGNTGLVGGQVPTPAGNEVVVSLTRLDRIRDVDPAGFTLTAEAGVILDTIHQAASAVDRLFPLSLGAEGSCRIGGNISTNAGGVGVLAYGNTRDLVLGLEVVLASGEVWNGLKRLRKDNTGYDLKQLFIGAEGTLGIVTAATLKLFPRPKAMETAFVGLSSPADALALFERARAVAGQSLTAFEIVPRIGLDFVLRHVPGTRDPLREPHPWYILVELSSGDASGTLGAVAENLLAEALEAGIAEDAVLAASLEQQTAFWKIRHALSESQKPEGGSIKHDVSVPIAAIPAFLDEASAAVEALVPGARIVAFGHLGDGNIHFNISQPVGADKKAFLDRWEEVNAVVHGIVTAMEGSISAEHGIGRLKRDLLPGVKSPIELDLMRRIKDAFDPNGILNPGRMLQER